MSNVASDNAAMVRAFWEQARRQVAKAKTADFNQLCIGPEVEYFLFKGYWGGSIATHAEKQQVLEVLQKLYPGKYSPELGAAAIEFHPGPVALNSVGLEGFLALCKQVYPQLVDVATQYGLEVGSYGTIPWFLPTGAETTPNPKYEIVPRYYAIRRKPWNSHPQVAGISLENPKVVGLLNAFQFSLQAENIKQGLEILNRMFYISPLAVALGANASFLGGKKTGFADCRRQVWKRSFDIRTLQEVELNLPTRVDLPIDYFNNITDYFADVASFPFILRDAEAAFQIGIGMYWKPARLKFINNNVVVEFRPLSTQKTPLENVQLACFVLGRLLWGIWNEEDYLPMDKVRQNLEQAEKDGLDATFLTESGEISARNVLAADIALAGDGLAAFGLLDNFASQLLVELKAKIES